MEHIALAGDIRQGLSLTGAETAAGVGDGCLGIEALIHQLQQADAPGVGIAMLLQTQQIAIGRGGIDTHEHRLAGLENLVVGSDRGRRAKSTLRLIARAGSTALATMLCTVPREMRQSKRSRSSSTTARYGAVANQHQGQDQLTQPRLGDGKVKENILGLRLGVEGLGQSVLGGVGLLVEELAADLMFPGQLRDGLSPSEDLDSQILPLLGQQPLGRPAGQAGRFRDWAEVGLRERARERSLGVHACLLCDDVGLTAPTPTWRKQAF